MESLCQVCGKNEIFFTRLAICKKCYKLDEYSRKKQEESNSTRQKSNTTFSTSSSSFYDLDSKEQNTIFGKRKWSSYEINTLEELWMAGSSWSYIVREFDRTEGAIRAKLKELMKSNEKMRKRSLPASSYQISMIEKLGGMTPESTDYSSKHASQYIDELIKKNGKQQDAGKAQKRMLLRLGFHHDLDSLNMYDASLKIQQLLKSKLGANYDSSKRVFENFLTFQKLFPKRTTYSNPKPKKSINYNHYDVEDLEDEEKCPNCSGAGCVVCDNTGSVDEFEASFLNGTIEDYDADDEHDVDAVDLALVSQYFHNVGNQQSGLQIHYLVFAIAVHMYGMLPFYQLVGYLHYRLLP